MFNGTNLTLNSDLALSTLLYIVGQKARESSDTSMSTCDGVGHIQWVLENQQDVSPTITHRRMKCMCGSRGGQRVRTSPRKSQKYRLFTKIDPFP